MSKVLRYLLRITLILTGELFTSISKYSGRISSNFLFLAQSVFNSPEWFDRRRHLLNPEKLFNDYWIGSTNMRDNGNYTRDKEKFSKGPEYLFTEKRIYDVNK